jgi:hypothetical protein
MTTISCGDVSLSSLPFDIQRLKGILRWRYHPERKATNVLKGLLAVLRGEEY